MDVTKGRIRQSVVSWCFEPMPLETLARHAAAIGLQGIENVEPEGLGDPQAARAGLRHDRGHGFVDGMNHKENHPMCIEKLRAAIEANGRRRLSQRHHLHRDAQRDARRRRPGEHGPRAEAGDRRRRAAAR